MCKHQLQITAEIFDKRGRLLSFAENSYSKTHPYQAKLAKKFGLHEKIFLHAEIAAIVKCKEIGKAHSIQITRHLPTGEKINVKPCIICSEAIKIANIKKIIYS